MIRYAGGFMAGLYAGRECPFFKDEEKVKKVIRSIRKNVKKITADKESEE